MKRDKLKRLIEAALFLSKDPIKPEKLYTELTDVTDLSTIRELFTELKDEYEVMNRGYYIREVAGGFQFVSRPQFEEFLKNFFKMDERKSITRASLEVLTIIAYKQPVTRVEIEDIRGVDSGSSIRNLLDRRLIRIIGRKDTPGRPYLYKTTRNFLMIFGLSSIKELPDIEDQEMLFEDYGEDEVE